MAKYEYEVVIYVDNTGSSLCFLAVDDFTVIVLTPTTTRLKQHCDNDIKCCTGIFSSPVSKQSFDYFHFYQYLHYINNGVIGKIVNKPSI